MFLPPATQDQLAFGHKDWPTACRELGSRGYADDAARILGSDQSPDKAYVAWWKDQVALCTGEGLAQQAELLATMDARDFLPHVKVPILIMAPTRSQLAVLEGKNSQRELHEMVPGSVLKIVDGVGHEIYVDCAAECQGLYLEFLGGLKN